MKIKFVVLSLLIPAMVLAASAEDSPVYVGARKKMVRQQIEARGISDKPTIFAMETVPRHLFVPKNKIKKAYNDHPLPIGQGQTISQPYIVALMTQSLKLDGSEKVLEIGTGSGYQAAILGKTAKSVYTIEIKEKLHQKATTVLSDLGYDNIKTRQGDGYFGWKSKAPFDCIMITASVDHIPPPLIRQLKDGGRLILPLGNPFSYQNLVMVTRKGENLTVRQITGVLFVPMTGHALDKTGRPQ